nr:MAG TPA: hypothetical protein [Caudoviricetes sp.]
MLYADTKQDIVNLSKNIRQSCLKLCPSRMCIACAPDSAILNAFPCAADKACWLNIRCR